MGLKHQEASEAAHPVDVGEAFQLGVTEYKLPVIRNQLLAISDQGPRERLVRTLCLTQYVSVRGCQASGEYAWCAIRKLRGC